MRNDSFKEEFRAWLRTTQEGQHWLSYVEDLKATGALVNGSDEVIKVYGRMEITWNRVGRNLEAEAMPQYPKYGVDSADMKEGDHIQISPAWPGTSMNQLQSDVVGAIHRFFWPVDFTDEERNASDFTMHMIAIYDVLDLF